MFDKIMNQCLYLQYRSLHVIDVSSFCMKYVVNMAK